MKKTLFFLFLLTFSLTFSQSKSDEVILTKIPSEVEGLIRIGDISASSSIPFGGQKKLRKKARKKLIKEAQLLRADVVLITVDNFAMTPINNVSLEGTAYKYPKEDEVNNEKEKAINKKIESSNIIVNKWDEVVLTKNPKDIEGLTKVKEYNVSSSIPFGGQKKLRKKAKEKIQKEAFIDECIVILIQTDEFSMSPINTINLIGIGYKK